MGALIGLGIGLRPGSAAWPWLSLHRALGPAAVGWLVGIVLSPIAGRLLYRRPSEPRQAASSGLRRALGRTMSVLAIAPAAVWLSALVGKGPLALTHRSDGNSPNIVLITVDAVRADHLGCYGSSQGLTPNLDAFARDATRYDAAYVSSPWTLTSLASVFSGLTPAECGLKLPEAEAHDWYTDSATLPAGIPFLPEQLRRAGYTTAAELTNGFLTPERGWRRGFAWYRNEDRGEEGDPATRADAITRHTLAWLRLNRDEPFFLWVHYIDPHLPYSSPDTPSELRARYSRGWPDRRSHWYETMRGAPEAMKTRYQEFSRVMYAEEVRYADRWVGTLLEGLKQDGSFDKSLIVISADHGEELFEHGGFEHGHSLHEEVLRVPLLVKWPAGWQADAEVTQTVGLTSLASTLLNAARLPANGDGQAPPLPRHDGEPDTPVYSESLLWGPEMTSLTTDEYKVIYHRFKRRGQQPFQVYDRRRDRAEKHDLAASGEAAELRTRLVELTAASEAAAAQWQRSGKQSARGTELPKRTRERLKALGYLGD